MRHAFIITAYNEFELLKKLLSFLSDEHCDIYMNIDHRGTLSQKEIESFISYPNVRYCSFKKIHWGGFSIIKEELNLIQIAVSEHRTDYIHLLSGQDYPIKPLEYFFDFFEKNQGYNFLDFRVATFDEVVRKYLYFLPYDYYNVRSDRGHRITTWLRNIQTKFHIRRSVSSYPDSIYHGSQWCSVTIDACEFLCDYTCRNRRFLKALKHTFAAEEIYIPTVLANNYRKETLKYDNNLRFIRWCSENGNNPSNLGLEHFKLLAASKALFARKFTVQSSRNLLEKIDNLLLCNYYNNQRYFEFEERIAIALVKSCKVLGISSLLFISDNLLYADALWGANLEVACLLETEEAKEMAYELNLENICQNVNIYKTQGIQSQEQFDAIVLINQNSKLNIDSQIQVLTENIQRLVARYIILVETGSTIDPTKFIDALLLQGIYEKHREVNSFFISAFPKDLKLSCCILIKN